MMNAPGMRQFTSFLPVEAQVFSPTCLSRVCRRWNVSANDNVCKRLKYLHTMTTRLATTVKQLFLSLFLKFFFSYCLSGSGLHACVHSVLLFEVCALYNCSRLPTSPSSTTCPRPWTGTQSDQPTTTSALTPPTRNGECVLQLQNDSFSDRVTCCISSYHMGVFPLATGERKKITVAATVCRFFAILRNPMLKHRPNRYGTGYLCTTCRKKHFLKLWVNVFRCHFSSRHMIVRYACAGSHFTYLKYSLVVLHATLLLRNPTTLLLLFPRYQL